jgi:hypothetical protein
MGVLGDKTFSIEINNVLSIFFSKIFKVNTHARDHSDSVGVALAGRIDFIAYDGWIHSYFVSHCDYCAAASRDSRKRGFVITHDFL